MSTVAPRQRANWHDAYDTQMALWRWYRTPEGQRYMANHLHEGSDPLRLSSQEMLLELYRSEMGRLIDCDPFYVSAEMCEVVEAAKDSFEPEPLLETDLLTPRGFVFFEQPFLVPDRFEVPVLIQGFSWIRTLAHDDSKVVEQLHAELEAAGKNDPAMDVRAYEQMVLSSTPGIRASGVSVTIYASRPTGFPTSAPLLIPMHFTPWYFGMTFDGNEVDENGVPTGARWWWQIIQTTLRLMQQRIAVKHQQRPDRAQRREGKSLRFPDDQTVVVVRLRREASEPSEPSGEEANYSHRFIVGGHWRMQPYPSEGIVRQIWISPYVKGPKDKPLIVKPKRVYQWDR